MNEKREILESLVLRVGSSNISPTQEKREKVYVDQALEALDKLEPRTGYKLKFTKVKIEDNTKIMIDSEKVAMGEHDGKAFEMFQSSNRNIITIKYNGHYYHVSLGQIADEILGPKGTK